MLLFRTIMTKFQENGTWIPSLCIWHHCWLLPLSYYNLTHCYQLVNILPAYQPCLPYPCISCLFVCMFKQIMLYTSFVYVHLYNEHLDFMPTWHICNIISDNTCIVIQLIWKFQESNWNPDWFIPLMDSFDTNYIFTNNKTFGQYDQNAIPSQIMPCYSYPGNLVNQNDIPIELTC